MNARQYLKQVKRLDTLASNKQGEIDNLRNLATKLSGDADGERVSGGSGSGDKLASVVSSIVDKERELDGLIDYYIDTRSAILKQIEMIDNPVYVEVLYRRYFKGETWERIAVDMNYSYQWVNSLHNRAVDKLDDILSSKVCSK